MVIIELYNTDNNIRHRPYLSKIVSKVYLENVELSVSFNNNKTAVPRQHVSMLVPRASN